MEQNFNRNLDLDADNQESLANSDIDNSRLEERGFSNRNFARKNSKKKFGLFLVLATVIVLLAGSQIYYNFVDPVKYDTPDWLVDQLSDEENQAQTIAELRESDRDRDGLTDYQELYQYYTSMFLEDTDSDGFTDYEEVNLGEDPLCPRGQSCNLLRLITPETKLSAVVQDVALDPTLTIAQAAANEFRNFLLENGMPKADLDVLTDQDLLDIFNIIDQSQILSESELSTTSTPAEIRDFLLSQPNASATEINALSDQDLMSIVDNLMFQ